MDNFTIAPPSDRTKILWKVDNELKLYFEELAGRHNLTDEEAYRVLDILIRPLKIRIQSRKARELRKHEKLRQASKRKYRR